MPKSKSDSWGTPVPLLGQLTNNEEFFDPCPWPRAEFDGLEIEWFMACRRKSFEELADPEGSRFEWFERQIKLKVFPHLPKKVKDQKEEKDGHRRTPSPAACDSDQRQDRRSQTNPKPSGLWFRPERRKMER